MSEAKRIESIIEGNKNAWNTMAKKRLFCGTAALPCVGPFGATVSPSDLFNTSTVQTWPRDEGIKGKTFLEIGCGSGHSIDWLIKKDAKYVAGIDFSREQLFLAKELNYLAIGEGKVDLFECAMEYGIVLPNPVYHTGFDVVFSLYAMGWSPCLSSVLDNTRKYLARDGRLIISWEHPMFARTSFCHDEKGGEAKYVVSKSYHNEDVREIDDYQGSGKLVLFYRKISTWTEELARAGFVIERIFEPEPVDAREGFEDASRYYSLPKAMQVPATIVFVCRKLSR